MTGVKTVNTQSNRFSQALWIPALALPLAVLSSNPAMALTVLDFEDLPAGTTVTNQYGARGVLFSNHFLDTHVAPHSGTRVLRSASLSTEIFTPFPIAMSFTSPQARVKLFAASTGVALNGTLTAFDAADNVVATDGPKPVAVDVFSAVFEVIDPDATPSIARAELRLENGIYFAIDDLEFDGQPPAPPPPAAPVVQITSPANGADLDVSTIDIAGTVTGEGLVSPAKLTVDFARPPGSTAPPFTSDLTLTGTGTTRQFSLPGFTGVPLGPVSITVAAENFVAQQGSASITFTNLPVAIRNRFTAEGGAGVFGAFRFGVLGSACKVAVYEFGAISDNGGGATFLIRGAILLKWLALLGSFDGCPTGEERDGYPGSRAQDFAGGRIYTYAPFGTFFVPAVFVDVIDNRGGDLVFGVPLADPSSSVGVMQTWLFQQFLRPDSPDLPSTIEIRGTPPTLWLERQLGAWFLGQLEPSARDRALNKSAATLWESFPCRSNLGPCCNGNVDPCTVGPEPPPPPNNPDVGETFCNGTTYIPTLEGFLGVPAEWEPVRGQYDATPVFGAIVSAHMTDIDNGFTHETHNGNCPYSLDFPGLQNPFTCISDYEFFVRPIGPQIDPSPLQSLLGLSNTSNIKTEYEVAYAALAHNFLRAPTTGDLVHMTGRWIIDCGHDTYKTELHPLFSFATMKTVVSETNGFTGLEDDLGIGGKRATRVAIWVNGWYPGGEGNEIEFDVFPPPRPNPDAVLHVIKPVDFAAGGYRAAEDVSMEFGFVPAGAAGHIHLKFSSPRRENEVTAAGEMKFQSGRQYWGIWYLYWGD